MCSSARQQRSTRKLHCPHCGKKDTFLSNGSVAAPRKAVKCHRCKHLPTEGRLMAKVDKQLCASWREEYKTGTVHRSQLAVKGAKEVNEFTVLVSAHEWEKIQSTI